MSNKHRNNTTGGLLLYALLIGLFALVLFVGYQIYEILLTQNEQTVIHYQEKQSESEIARKELQALLKEIDKLEYTQNTNYLSEVKDYNAQPDTPPEKKTEPTTIEPKTKPRPQPTPQPQHKQGELVIIIDDITTQAQRDVFKALKIPVNLSYIPPNARHPQSASIAQSDPHAMIHLPLQGSASFGNQESDVLSKEDTAQTIQERIQKLKLLYPHVKFINNHTGSVFTADYQAMARLLPILAQNDLIFVDSKTTAQTKAPTLQAKLGQRYYKRDIFLDNEIDERYIKNQIKEAIEIAKTNGYAIAIGHPHQATIKALIHSSTLLKSVNVVYLEEL